MDTPKPRFPILLTLAGIALLTLLILPATRWLLLRQFRMELLQPERPDPAAVARLLQQRPNDYPIHLAHALWPARPQDEATSASLLNDDQGRARLARLADLAARFPQEPSAHATLLRYLALGYVKLHRDEETIYSGGKVEHKPGDKLQSDPEYLAMFERAAEAGERLDSENGFFPMMRAVGLFDQRRDEEAIAALKRAAQKTRWEDYSNDEVAGRMRLETEVYGERDAISRVAMHASVLFPHYAALRSEARMAMYKATEVEQDGHTGEGVAIRHALMHCGSLMRVQSRSYIGTLVGIAITAIGTARPGGAPLVKFPANITDEQRKQLQLERLNKFYDYLRTNGHTDEARWAEAEINAGLETKEIGTVGMDQSPFNTGGFTRLLAAWVANLALLSNLLLLLALGGAAWLATKIKPKKGLLWWRVGLCVLLTGGALAWQWGLFRVGAKPYQEMIFAFSGITDSDRGVSQGDLAFLIAGLSVFVPLLTLLILTIASSSEKVPIPTGVGRGLRRVALPLGSLLFLTYGGLLMVTVRQEAAINARQERIVAHEGRYFAELAGRPWPGMPQP